MSKFLSHTFVLVIELVIFGSTIADPVGPLKCPLTWTMMTTDSQIPLNAIASQRDYQYVAKGSLDEESDEILGRMEMIENTAGPALIPDSPNSTEVHVFQVLTNDHGCVYAWTSKREDITKFGVKFNGQLIARVSSDNIFLPGIVTGSSISYVDLDGSISQSNTYLVLTSYSRGLSLSLTNFEMFPDNSAGLDFLGVDEIHNNAEVEISQTVTHSKSVTESFSFSEHESTTTSFSIAANLDVSASLEGIGVGAGIGVEFGMSWEKGWEKEVVNSRTREISVSRTVTVPPLTKIQACSTIKSKENFTIDYSAEGRYRAPGLTGEEVVEIVRSGLGDGREVIAVGNTAFIEVSGKISGSMSLSTQFIVNPLESPYGCTELEEDIQKSKAARKRLAREEFLAELKGAC